MCTKARGKFITKDFSRPVTALIWQPRRLRSGIAADGVSPCSEEWGVTRYATLTPVALYSLYCAGDSSNALALRSCASKASYSE